MEKWPPLVLPQRVRSVFFFNDTATTEIYTLSLHDALPIYDRFDIAVADVFDRPFEAEAACHARGEDRKSTRLNSSHWRLSYAVFCLKKQIRHERLPPAGAAGHPALDQRRSGTAA